MHSKISDFSQPSEDEVGSATDLLRMLADPTRLRILWALAQGESSVACLAELAATTPTSVSQHLGKLRLSGVVKARREGTFQFYTVADPQVLSVLETVFGRKVEPPVEEPRFEETGSAGELGAGKRSKGRNIGTQSAI